MTRPWNLKSKLNIQRNSFQMEVFRKYQNFENIAFNQNFENIAFKVK